MLGRPAADGDAQLGVVVVRPLDDVPLELRGVDRRSCSLCEVGHAAEVVPVRVGDEDRDARRSLPRQLEPQLGSVAAGIDDDRLACGAVRAHDVAVRPDRAELVAVDGERHYLAEEPRAFAARFCASLNISESMK